MLEMPASVSADRIGSAASCGTASHHQDSAGPESGERLRYLADPASAEPYIRRDGEVEANHAATRPSRQGRC